MRAAKCGLRPVSLEVRHPITGSTAQQPVSRMIRHQTPEAAIRQVNQDLNRLRQPNLLPFIQLSEEHIRAISNAAERMPAKSTYFYPKLASGLVFNPLE